MLFPAGVSGHPGALAWAGLPAPEAYHLSRLEEHPVLQFLAYITPQEYGRLAPLRHIEITGSGHSIADIIPLGGGKEVGIAAVAQRFGWKREEIMVFGDGPNDAKMLAWAGAGVAMGQRRGGGQGRRGLRHHPRGGGRRTKRAAPLLGCWKKPSYKKADWETSPFFYLVAGTRALQQIVFYVPHKLVAAPGQLPQHPVEARLCLVPILLGDVVAGHRADLEGDFGEGQLVEHQAAPGVEGLADDEGRAETRPFSSTT